MDSGKAPVDYSATKAQVASAVHTSMIRLAKGGVALHINSSGIHHQIMHCLSFSANCNLSWTEQLKEIAHTSVSFPNGTNHANSNNINGSPSDVDVRAALTLYNRIKKRFFELQYASNDRAEEQQNSGPSKKKKRSLPQARIVFDIISDLGTHRRVTDAKSLANLLSIEIEQELSTENTSAKQANTEDFDTGTPAKNSTLLSNKFATKFFDIRPSDSGIICLVSSSRSQELHAAGRVPCALCVKWCKGMKGLWWHQLKEHGVDYSNAMEVAAGSVNELAVVKFQERSCWLPRADATNSSELSPEHTEPLQENTDNSGAVDAFELVRNGDLEALARHIENGFAPDNHLDKNGANCLHWAAGCGHLHITSYLIEACNCCPNEGQVGKRSFSGRTPLHWAARNGHLNVVNYLIDQCNVNIEAKTLDGTTAFCWAAWQGHFEVMKFLHKNGCDINSLNSFGCNALLWCSQGAATAETLSWLYASGADFRLVNDNGHSALHKAAQRGNTSACKWLVDMFLHEEQEDFDGFLLIGPDAEGACPSDLCGMNGHEILAEWIAKQECDYVRRHLNACEPSLKCRKLLNSTALPTWLKDSAAFDGTQNIEPADGIGRMKYVLLANTRDVDLRQCERTKQRVERNGNLNEID